jgi:hypothetical protein
MLDMVMALVMALVCIFLHFEAVLLIERWAGAMRGVRMSLLATWTGLLFAHVIEIWLYALLYYWCAQAGIGQLHGVTSFIDYGYYSAVVYTTLGFGDVVPDPGLHMLTGSEALVGLSLIAWSATITYGRVLLHQANRD